MLRYTLLLHRLRSTGEGLPGALLRPDPPKSPFATITPEELRRPQGPRTGVNAIIGAWPGEETRR